MGYDGRTSHSSPQPWAPPRPPPSPLYPARASPGSGSSSWRRAFGIRVHHKQIGARRSRSKHGLRQERVWGSGYRRCRQGGRGLWNVQHSFGGRGGCYRPTAFFDQACARRASCSARYDVSDILDSDAYSGAYIFQVPAPREFKPAMAVYEFPGCKDPR